MCGTLDPNYHKEPSKPTPEPSRPTPESTIPAPGTPYIPGENGGWEVIKDKISEAEPGQTIQIDMNGSTTIGAEALEALKGLNVNIQLDMGDGITWTINGMDITADTLRDINLGVSTGGNIIPVDVVNNITGKRYSIEITLEYDGEFGFTAYLKVNLEPKNEGLYANLFYYVAETTEMEFVTYAEIAADGSVAIPFTHASDYLIVIDDHPLDGSADTEPEDSEAVDSKEPVQEPVSSQTGEELTAWNPVWLLVIGAILLIVIAGGMVWYKIKQRDNIEDADNNK